MGVSEVIRKVPRPKNTVVIDYGEGHGNLRYAVRERTGVRYVRHSNPQPINGRVIGHIIDGTFVPVVPVMKEEADFLSFGPSAFVKSVSDDLYSDLLKVFPAAEAQQIMVIASIKAFVPAVRYSRLNTEYEANWISLYYPDTALSPNTIGHLLKLIGMNAENRQAFFNLRLARVLESHHLIIDGMLKTDSSTVNDFSAFSRKARVKGCEDISLLYAYDLEKGEPICSEVFAGNCIDAVSYHSFIEENHIERGVIVTDKGFPPSAIEDELKAHSGLHFLTPIKRSDKRVLKHQMLNFDEVLPGFSSTLYAKKAKLSNGHFLYSFRDVDRAALEEKSLSRGVLHGKAFNKEKYWEQRSEFGSIVFESDQDLSLANVYKIYDARWAIELLFKAFKNEECLDETNVQSDYSVVGSEFINFIATVLTHRMIRAAKDTGLLEHQTFGELIRDISRTFRLRKFKDRDPVFKDGGWTGCMPKPMAELVALGLCKDDKANSLKTAINRVVTTEQPKKRGRPPKWPKPVGEFVGPKRHVGRPRKHPKPDEPAKST